MNSILKVILLIAVTIFFFVLSLWIEWMIYVFFIVAAIVDAYCFYKALDSF